jgi:hypothetical protein
MHIGYWWESKKERHHWDDLDVGGWTIIKMDLRDTGWDRFDWCGLG